MTKLFICEFELFKKHIFPYWLDSFTRCIKIDTNIDDSPPNQNDKNVYYPDETPFFHNTESSLSFAEQVFGWNCAIYALREEGKI